MIPSIILGGLGLARLPGGGGAPSSAKIWFARANTYENSGNPAADTGEAFTGLTGTLYPCVALFRASSPTHQITANFDSGDLVYSPPAGFTALGGTWNPSDKDSTILLSGSDRIATKQTSNSFANVRGNTALTSGRWYWEIVINEASVSTDVCIGVATSAVALNDPVGNDANGWSYYQNTGQSYHSGSLAAYGGTYGNGTVVGVAVQIP